jgi:hypothetical protein
MVISTGGGHLDVVLLDVLEEHPEGLAALLGERGAVPGVVLDHDLADGTRAREALGQRGLVHRREPEVREDAIEGAAKSPGAIPTAMVASESFFEKGAMELAEVVPREEIARGLPVDPRAAVDVAGVVERRAHLDGVGQRLLDDRGPVALRTLRRQQDAIDDVDDTISRLDVRLDDARLADPDLKHHRLAAQRLDAAGGEQILREDAAVHDVESEHGLQAVPVLGDGAGSRGHRPAGPRRRRPSGRTRSRGRRSRERPRGRRSSRR